jgi:hypothetical protein
LSLLIGQNIKNKYKRNNAETGACPVVRPSASIEDVKKLINLEETSEKEVVLG